MSVLELSNDDGDVHGGGRHDGGGDGGYRDDDHDECHGGSAQSNSRKTSQSKNLKYISGAPDTLILSLMTLVTVT